MSEYVLTVYRTVQQKADVEFSTDLPLEVRELINDKLIDIISIEANHVTDGDWETIEVDEYTFNTKEIKDA
tara:strand:+ start:232 stop:444 length:213 start_codon:yes stop_codon:yes gene_type:complete